ncbi:signal peptide peptidase SppA [Treponema phagedenis]|uniref:Signal peptide peptidase SppA n=1 Tax=Treponema phagedenis TaxID=162 RepID=A0A0B7GW95_TREPH|nr:signal peptide peptidase SppA [Treponema phagedenis]NVP23566.1 signal peptide peptidase SppA [Treponema phagedenis]QEJ98700.1 signal peptide peptidase SppA [Treponema phagedenis]QEK01569.1 signal peptide peptidase SppA [Treponema phagedenis]QEK06655.1 signal peptide peptidase SppA [Treponema phagedenis]QLC58403.1 signal peptide peptidase SppA [Treponema phagedenis]
MSQKKGFFRSLFRSINVLRLVIINIVFFFFFFLFLAALQEGGNKKQPVKKLEQNSVLLINPSGFLSEEERDFDFAKLVFRDEKQIVSVSSIIRALKQAAYDRRIDCVFFDLSGLSGWSSGYFSDFAAALQEYKKSGKKLYVFSNSYSLAKYYLASFADEIILDPLGSVDLSGFYNESLFFGGMEEKFDIHWNVVQAGAYKSMAETYSQKEMSEGVKENHRALFTNIWENYIKEVATNRNLPTDVILHYVDNYLDLLKNHNGDPAETALSAKLVTKIASYEDAEVDLGLVDKDTFFENKNFISLDDYNFYYSHSESTNKIGIIYLKGAISSYGTRQNDAVTSGYMLDLFDLAVNDPDVKAIVLRIDSGGGEVFASEEIRRAVERCIVRAKKPVVVSMGAVAASGAYWIASSADYIFASPYTITGSIGVLAVMPTFEAALQKYLGITVDGVYLHKFRPYTGVKNMSETDKSLLQFEIMSIYKNFITKVSTGRKLSFDKVSDIAGGKVYSGATAKNLGLVDELGNLSDAIAYAAKLADCDGYSTKVIKRPLSYKEELLKSLMEAKAEMNISSNDFRILYELLSLRSKRGVYVYTPVKLQWNTNDYL